MVYYRDITKAQAMRAITKQEVNELFSGQRNYITRQSSSRRMVVTHVSEDIYNVTLSPLANQWKKSKDVYSKQQVLTLANSWGLK